MDGGRNDGPLRRADAQRHLAGHALRPGPVGRVGVELEWLVAEASRPTATVGLTRLQRLLDSVGGLPGGGRLTLEPGGQLELSSALGADLAGCLAAVHRDVAVVFAAASRAGLVLVGLGADPVRTPERVVRNARYDAMERHWQSTGCGPAGRTMMCSTAAVQVNLEAGEADQQGRRWRLAHAVGPVLLAAFANSPLLGGQRTGWRSARQAMWTRLERCRTAPLAGPSDFAEYALAASVMLVTCARGPFLRPGTGLSFGDWLDGTGEQASALGRPPTLADLDYHCTTLFPPVRPRGWLELRFLDAQAPEHWPVAVAVTATLLDDPAAARAAELACAPVAGRWAAAAQHGLADPALAGAARVCFAVAAAALRERAPALAAAVTGYARRYVECARCPADDVVEGAAAHGPSALLSAAPSFAEELTCP